MTIAVRELASLRKEKTIVLALLIQLFVAAFSSFLVVGLVSMYDPSAVQGYTTDLGIAGEEVDPLAAVAEDTAGVDPTSYSREEAAMAAFEDGEVDAVVVTERLDDGRIRATVTVPEGSFRTTLIVVTVRDVLEGYERRLRERRDASLEHELVEPPPEVESTPYFGFTYTVLLPLLLFLPVFIAGSIAVDSLTEEFERGTLELLRVTPATAADIVEGKLLAAAAPVPAQAALWIGLLSINGTGVAHVIELLVLVTSLAVAVSAVGLGVGAVTRDRRLAQFLYSTGILGLFGATLLLPETPANTVARLAIGSPGRSTYLALGGYVLLGAVALGTVRRLTGYVDADHL